MLQSLKFGKSFSVTLLPLLESLLSVRPLLEDFLARCILRDEDCLELSDSLSEETAETADELNDPSNDEVSVFNSDLF